MSPTKILLTDINVYDSALGFVFPLLDVTYCFRPAAGRYGTDHWTQLDSKRHSQLGQQMSKKQIIASTLQLHTAINQKQRVLWSMSFKLATI